jgi:hypothetical protein
MSAEDDRLVYDGELGWIDPEDILGSLGVTIAVEPDYLIYREPSGDVFRVPRRGNWPLLRECLADAEHRDFWSEGG